MGEIQGEIGVTKTKQGNGRPIRRSSRITKSWLIEKDFRDKYLIQRYFLFRDKLFFTEKIYFLQRKYIFLRDKNI